MPLITSGLAGSPAGHFNDLLTALSNDHALLVRQNQDLFNENLRLRSFMQEHGHNPIDLCPPDVGSEQPMTPGGQTPRAPALVPEAQGGMESHAVPSTDLHPVRGSVTLDLAQAQFSRPDEDGGYRRSQSGAMRSSLKNSVSNLGSDRAQKMQGIVSSNSLADTNSSSLAIAEESQVSGVPLPRGGTINTTQSNSSGWSSASEARNRKLTSTLENAGYNVVCRLQARLGANKFQGLVSAKRLLDSVRSLGLGKLDLADMERLIEEMCRVTGFDQSFAGTGSKGKRNSLNSQEDAGAGTSSVVSMGFAMAQSEVHALQKKSFFGSKAQKMSQMFDSSLARSKSGDSGSAHSNGGTDFTIAIPFSLLSEVLLNHELNEKMASAQVVHAATIREVLLSGEANLLIAELTCVRVDDLAAPEQRIPAEDAVEPFVAMVILLNGILIGVQSDITLDRWGGWRWVEVAFTVFFTSEMFTRIYLSGFRYHFAGEDWGWNGFDAAIVLIAIIDVILTFVALDTDFVSVTILRTLRLTRLARLIRIFRLKAMADLNIMVKGLLAGFKTLGWAIVLLFFVVYIVAVFTTVTFQESALDPVAREELFTSVPRSMFTGFRCFIGECFTSEGRPIAKLLADQYGLPFIIGYMASMLFVILGLFNLIMAIYVENTMSAAKRNSENNQVRRQRESLRVAKLAKDLLLKFCTAHRLAVDNQEKILTGVHDPETDLIFSRALSSELRYASEQQTFEELETDMLVSRELFLILIQDPLVQSDLDELDVPPDRAHLFDVLDADGSGSLQADELLLGLLKVRGEARKSDQVACLLAVKALHEVVRDLFENQERLLMNAGLDKAEKVSRVTVRKSMMHQLNSVE